MNGGGGGWGDEWGREGELIERVRSRSRKKNRLSHHEIVSSKQF